MARVAKWWRAGWFLSLAVSCWLQGPGLWAQDTEVPERGLQVTGSYRLGDIETINTKNGNVMLSVPLASLAARAGRQSGLSVEPQLQQQAVGPVRAEPGSGGS